jgi:hypothetical protein
MTFKEIIIAILIALGTGIILIHYQYNLENNSTTTTKPEIILSIDKDKPTIHYQVNNITNSELIYFSLINIDSTGKELYLLQNKIIKPGKLYSLQTEIKHNEYGTIIKRLSLEKDEYFKAIAKDKDNNILADAELRI